MLNVLGKCPELFRDFHLELKFMDEPQVRRMGKWDIPRALPFFKCHMRKFGF